MAFGLSNMRLCGTSWCCLKLWFWRKNFNLNWRVFFNKNVWWLEIIEYTQKKPIFWMLKYFEQIFLNIIPFLFFPWYYLFNRSFSSAIKNRFPKLHSSTFSTNVQFISRNKKKNFCSIKTSFWKLNFRSPKIPLLMLCKRQIQYLGEHMARFPLCTSK
jgi:hypothetical protein